MGIPKDKIEQNLKIDFLNLKKRTDVGTFFNIKNSFLNALNYKKRRLEFYTNFAIKKRSGEERIISAPIPYLKSIQKRISVCLYLIYKQKAPAHGFSRNKSILSNAKKHQKAKIILNLDIQDFFPSITFRRIHGMFLKKPYQLSPEISLVLTQICCDENGLPQGAPTSPVISNMICSKLDSELQRFAVRNRCVYTRYVDDITFSTTEKKFPENVINNGELGVELRSIIEDNDFFVNEKKTKLRTKHQRQQITGLVVNEFPNTKKDFNRNLRTLVYLVDRYGIDKARKIFKEKQEKKKDLIRVIDGKLNFIKFVRSEESDIYQKLKNKFDSSINREIKYLSKDEKINAGMWVLECDGEGECNDIIHQGTAFNLEGVGIVTCEHVLCPRMKIFKTNSSNQYKVEKISKSIKGIDLAILKVQEDISDKNFIPFVRSGESAFKNQQGVRFVGFPNYGVKDSPTIITTEVSNIRKKNGMEMIMLNALIENGTSGGPLLNSDGKVIGVVAYGYIEEDSGNRVIPIENIDKLI